MAGSKTGKHASAAQKTALAKGRAKARVAHPAGRQTGKQLAAERANLVIARAAQSAVHRAQTPAQLVAERNNLAKARAVAHAKHGKGHQTAAQLAAERRNLAKARLHRHNHRHGRGHSGLHRHGHHHGRHGSSHTIRPLGTHRISFNGAYKLTIKMPTGTNKKFVKRIAPTGFMTRTSWHSSRTHHFQKRLHTRRKRVAGVKHWHRRKGRLTPR